MFNRGPTVNLIVGFPLFGGGGPYFVPGGFADFDPAKFREALRAVCRNGS